MQPITYTKAPTSAKKHRTHPHSRRYFQTKMTHTDTQIPRPDWHTKPTPTKRLIDKTFYTYKTRNQKNQIPSSLIIRELFVGCDCEHERTKTNPKPINKHRTPSKLFLTGNNKRQCLSVPPHLSLKTRLNWAMFRQGVECAPQILATLWPTYLFVDTKSIPPWSNNMFMTWFVSIYIMRSQSAAEIGPIWAYRRRRYNDIYVCFVEIVPTLQPPAHIPK